MPDNVTLRGAGADKTFLIFTGSISCNGANPGICFLGDQTWYGGSNAAPGGSNAATWTAGYAQGSNQIALQNVGSTGFSEGEYIYLDQLDDSSVGSDFFICDQNSSAPNCSAQAGAEGRSRRHQVQIVQVVSCSPSCPVSGGAGPYTVTITPGLYAPNWSAAKSPGAWFAGKMRTGAGVENLSLDTSQIASSSADQKGIQFDNAANCWLKGIRSIRNPGRRSQVELQNATHISIVDSYFYFGGTGSSVSYAIETKIATDNLIQNNIFHRIGPMMNASASAGNVWAYNYSINQPSSPSTWFTQGIWTHDAGAEYVLMEGNVGPGLMSDAIHGTTGFNTAFRNWFKGSDTGKSSATIAVALVSYNRYYNFVGNVLGTPAYTSTYQVTNQKDYPTSGAVFVLGSGDSSDGAVVSPDPMVATTAMRWGNYDVVNNAVRWEPSEVPSGIGTYANGIPASQNLPASFYLPAKPAWWNSSKPWPAIGPDVTGGNIANLGGHANTVPAQDCFMNVMKGPSDGNGSVLNFNSDACYSTQQAGPAAPTNLSVVAK